MILYLMSKYTGREAESLKENQDAWLALNQKGYLVYSPICESHNIEEHRKLLFGVKCNGQIYDLDHDMTHNKGAFHEWVLKYEKQPDYVARDLRLIAAWLKNDADICENSEHYNCDVETRSNCQLHDYARCNEYETYAPNYDSGVVGVVLPSAYFHGTNAIDQPTIFFTSNGALKEYQFCKEHHILVISLETALTIPKEQWEEYEL